RAGAGVVAEVEPADVDLVLPAGLRVGDPVVGEDAVLAQVLDLEVAGPGPLPADVDLFLAEHGSARRGGGRGRDGGVEVRGGDGAVPDPLGVGPGAGPAGGAPRVKADELGQGVARVERVNHRRVDRLCRVRPPAAVDGGL